MSPTIHNYGDGLTRVEPASGFWLVRYADWSGVAVFDREVDALRYCVEHSMHVCEFLPWGEVR